MPIEQAAIDNTISRMIETHGEENRFRIERGAAQVAEFWRENDGSPDEYTVFCLESFIGNQAMYEETFDRLDRIFEALDGHFVEMMKTMQEKLHLDIGPITPLDMSFAAYNPAAHMNDDFFGNKIAFMILLNFPRYILDEKRSQGASWDERQWAMARLGNMFASRVPAELNQKVNTVITAASHYIDEYNIYLGNLYDLEGKHIFPKDLKLISHWGLRDELKAHYGQDDGLRKQELIYKVMERIITQEIPEKVINNSEMRWNPFDNVVIGKVSDDAGTPEPDTRYQHLMNIFRALRDIDPYCPANPRYIDRVFLENREMTIDEVTSLFDTCLSASVFAKTADVIKKRLGRDLRPFDIWYDGFKARSGISESKLDETVKSRYANIDAFAEDMPNILKSLGFSDDQANFVAPKVVVEAARGAGHAWGAEMRGAVSRLSTRVPKGGMDYKGFNIAAHEFGHNVEQTYSLHGPKYHLHSGVPFTGFSEAIAFLFQNRDLDILGIENPDKNAAHMKTLDLYWSACEIMGVAIVDIKVWQWLYEHTDASVADLKKAIINIAKEVWNTYLADSFGSRDEIILGIYSHMISYPLYLAEYPLGHLIEYQLDSYLDGKKFGAEIERFCSQGTVVPQLWMKNAVGSELSAQPLIDAVEKSLTAIE